MAYQNLIYTSIDEKYGAGHIGEFEVVIMRSNGFVNASKLVLQAKSKDGNPKLYTNWHKLDTAKTQIEAVSKHTGTSSESLLIEVKGGNDQRITGTYAHPLLIPMIAQWASAEYAVMVSLIMLKHHEVETQVVRVEHALERAVTRTDLETAKKCIEEANREKERLESLIYDSVNDYRLRKQQLKEQINQFIIRHNEDVTNLADKNVAYGLLLKKNSSLEEQLQEINGKLDESNRKIDEFREESNRKLDTTLDELADTKEELHHVATDLGKANMKLDDVAENINPPLTDKTKLESVVLMRCGNEAGNYYVIRAQNRNIVRQIADVCKKYPSASEIFRIDPVANSVSFRHHLKEQFATPTKTKRGQPKLPSELSISYNLITLPETTSEQRLIEIIELVNNMSSDYVKV